MLIAAFLGSHSIPFDLKDFLDNGITFQIGGPGAAAVEDTHFPIIEQPGTAGIVKNSRDIGSQEVLPVSQAHYQRAVLAGGNNFIRFAGSQDGNGVGAFHPFEGLANRCFQITVIIILN